MPKFGYFIIIFLVITVILSAFFSGAEIVNAKVNKLKLEKASKKDKKAKLAFDLNSDYNSLIGTILVGNNLVNVAASSAATILATSIWQENGELIAAISMTLIILVFGEILPKTILSKQSYKMTLKMAKTLKVMKIIFFPIVCIVNKIIGKCSKLWTPKEKMPTATDEELITMVEEIEQSGFIDADTGDLLKSAIDFVDVMAFEIMTPRVDIISIDVEDNLSEIMHEEDFFTYSRIPIYEETIDNIIGIVNTNDLLKLALNKEKINLKELMTKPIYVHKTKPISSILADFKEQHIHIAIVIDEFGGTLGIVTLEDILEELVGDIWDETDEVIEEFKEEKNGDIIVDGDMNIYDMFDLLEKEDKDFESEYSTVGGWCTEMLEKFPEANESFTYKNLKLTILEVDGVRVEKVKVEILDVEEEKED